LKKFAIIVAGGIGKRYSNTIPKQFDILCGKPVLMHSVEAFHRSIPDIDIIIVLAESLQNEWKKLCQVYNFSIPHKLVAGGSERFYSVKNGLALVDQDGIVAVHDAARPLISNEVIIRSYDLALVYKAVVPVVEISDSVRKIEGQDNEPVDRAKLRLVQTPQVFMTSILKKAYEQQYNESFTDDASVVEAHGVNIFLTKGDAENIKITRAADLVVAEALKKHQLARL